MAALWLRCGCGSRPAHCVSSTGLAVVSGTGFCDLRRVKATPWPRQGHHGRGRSSRLPCPTPSPPSAHASFAAWRGPACVVLRHGPGRHALRTQAGSKQQHVLSGRRAVQYHDVCHGRARAPRPARQEGGKNKNKYLAPRHRDLERDDKGGARALQPCPVCRNNPSHSHWRARVCVCVCVSV